MSAPRFQALDLFRGLTVALMIIVNTPGDWQHIYSPLQHAKYNGCTLADIVFPFFIFAMGMSVQLALNKFSKLPHNKVWKRFFYLLLLGLLLNIIPFSLELFSILYTPSKWRFFGVLQRLSIVYLCTCYISHKRSLNELFFIAGLLLCTYALLLLYIPFPFLNNSSNAGSLEHGYSLPAYIDSLIFSSNHLYYKHVLFSYDPEGVLSTIPCIVTALAGVITTKVIAKQQNKDDIKLKTVSIWGLITILILILSLALSVHFPLNKTLWTPSYTLLTISFALITLILSKIISHKAHMFNRIKSCLFILGRMPLKAYVLSILLERFLLLVPLSSYNLKTHFVNLISLAVTNKNLSSLCYSLFFLTITVCILHFISSNQKIGTSTMRAYSQNEKGSPIA